MGLGDEHGDRAATAQRVGEVDDLLRPVNLVAACAVAGAAPLFWARYGAMFVFFCLLPIAWWTTRVMGLHRRIGLTAWNVGLVLILSATISGGTISSDGHTSPTLFFAGLVGLFVQMMWPQMRHPSVVGLTIIAIVVITDVGRDRPLDGFVVIAVVLITVYLPVAARQIVTIEEIHRRRAVLDTLTGCLNRRSLEDRSSEIVLQAQRLGTPVAAVSFDIDHFKGVNDRHGHATGDRVLENVAYVARKELRRFEMLFRVGGEEFLVLLPGLNLAEAAEIAERLRKAIESATTNNLTVTASFGVAATNPPLDMDALLDEADRNLYIAKRAGRNRVVSDGLELSSSHS